MMINKPLITIITVCYNSENFIRETIESVLNQTYDNIEYIVVDGNSTDNTLNIIKEYETKFNGRMKWISEPDDGIYDAMNKGIELMKGEWINFMNSGDLLINNKIIDRIFVFDNLDLNNIEVIYGDVLVNYNNEFKIKRKAKNINKIWKGMICSHQSMFIKNNLIKKLKFNKNNLIVADYEFMLKALKNQANFQYINKVVSEVISGGMSDKKRLKVIKDYYKTYNSYYDMSVRFKIWYSYYFIKNIFKKISKKILPDSFIMNIIKRKSQD